MIHLEASGISSCLDFHLKKVNMVSTISTHTTSEKVYTSAWSPDLSINMLTLIEIATTAWILIFLLASDSADDNIWSVCTTWEAKYVLPTPNTLVLYWVYIYTFIYKVLSTLFCSSLLQNSQDLWKKRFSCFFSHWE